ncbi:MAG: hypothetical protein DU430_03520, partial [Candidatus Tokpelaia sp.]
AVLGACDPKQERITAALARVLSYLLAKSFSISVSFSSIKVGRQFWALATQNRKETRLPRRLCLSSGEELFNIG